MTAPRTLLTSLLAVAIAALCFASHVSAQGPALSRPLEGDPKVNCYLDHDCPRPFCSKDGYMLHYSGAHTLDGSVGSSWRGTYSYDRHEGIDYYTLYTGTDVLAAAGGKVALKGWDEDGYGNYIVINHGCALTTLYAHLSDYSGIIAGQEVAQGEFIADSGSTGNSTGPHLHFDVRINNNVTDPYGWYGEGDDPLAAVTGNPPSQRRWEDPTDVTVIVEEGDPDLYIDSFAPTNWDRTGYSYSRFYTQTVTGTTGRVYAKWFPDRAASGRQHIPPGPYSVYAWIPGTNATTTNATYKIYHRDGTTVRTVDQMAHSDEWVPLGRYYFSGATDAEYVYLNNQTGEGDKTISFDAIRFEQHRVFGPQVRTPS